MSRTITAREATVKTASVEVKTLTISGKQVTLSVFRQIKEEPIMHDSTDLQGVPWGIVNYFWGECAKREHLHVVWQNGSELRRSCVWPTAAGSLGWARLRQEAMAAFTAYVFARLAEMDLSHGFEVTGLHEYGGQIADYANIAGTVNTETWRVYIKELPPFEQESLQNWYRASRRTSQDVDPAVPQAMREIAGRRTGVIGLNQTHALLGQRLGAIQDYEERWRRQYAALSNLDHLFIAV